jgi:hypothetical protein
MESNGEFPPYRSSSTPNHQLVIITQLLQIAANIRHIDEMFLWLAHSMGQRLGLEAIQFWTNQNYIGGQCAPQLRAMACRQNTIPFHVLSNPQMSEVAGNLLYERSGAKPQSVGNALPMAQSEMLTHYNLHYWTGSFLHYNALLPPMNDDLASGAVATPLAMVILLFTQQPPLANLSSNVSRIVEYALSVAKNRGLLVPESAKPFSSSPNLAAQRAQPKQLTLDDLIPRRSQDAASMQADNPFANAVVISDKRARQVYFAIDGKRSIPEVLKAVRMDKEALASALRFLLNEQLIDLYGPDGKPVESSQFLRPF